MAQINKPSDYFNTLLWTGDNTSPRSLTGVGFQPDLVWVKNKVDGASPHHLTDVVRGVGITVSTNLTSGDITNSAFGYLNSFDSDGFTVQTGATNNARVNQSPDTYVAWNWLAGGTASSNTDGSITSQVSANTTSGFSIVSYTGTGANATVGHGLGVAPKVVLIKGRSTTLDWVYGGDNIGWTKYLVLNKTDTSGTASTVWNDTAPTSSVFSLGSNAAVNQSGATQIAYCFSEVKGFSKFGSYTGNGNADGTFVYTGFKPAFVLIKNITTAGTPWLIYDTTRNEFNVVTKTLVANTSDAEATSSSRDMDILSNGFKARGSSIANNQNGLTHIYMAFAENPLVGANNIPATAR